MQKTRVEKVWDIVEGAALSVDDYNTLADLISKRLSPPEVKPVPAVVEPEPIVTEQQSEPIEVQDDAEPIEEVNPVEENPSRKRGKADA